MQNNNNTKDEDKQSEYNWLGDLSLEELNLFLKLAINRTSCKKYHQQIRLHSLMQGLSVTSDELIDLVRKVVKHTEDSIFLLEITAFRLNVMSLDKLRTLIPLIKESIKQKEKSKNADHPLCDKLKNLLNELFVETAILREFEKKKYLTIVSKHIHDILTR